MGLTGEKNLFIFLPRIWWNNGGHELNWIASVIPEGINDLIGRACANQKWDTIQSTCRHPGTQPRITEPTRISIDDWFYLCVSAGNVRMKQTVKLQINQFEFLYYWRVFLRLHTFNSFILFTFSPTRICVSLPRSTTSSGWKWLIFVNVETKHLRILIFKY